MAKKGHLHIDCWLLLPEKIAHRGKKNLSGRFYRVLWLDQRATTILKIYHFFFVYQPYLIDSPRWWSMCSAKMWQTPWNKARRRRISPHAVRLMNNMMSSTRRASMRKKVGFGSLVHPLHCGCWGQNHWMRKLIWHPSGSSLIANSHLSID